MLIVKVLSQPLHTMIHAVHSRASLFSLTTRTSLHGEVIRRARVTITHATTARAWYNVGRSMNAIEVPFRANDGRSTRARRHRPWGCLSRQRTFTVSCGAHPHGERPLGCYFAKYPQRRQREPAFNQTCRARIVSPRPGRRHAKSCSGALDEDAC